MRVLAIFGPTAVGKTGVAIELAELLRERGEDPVAINCDSIQVYRGLEILSGAASAEQRARLEHRLLGFVADRRASSRAGRFAELAARRDRRPARGRAGGRSWSAAPASTCARRSPSSSCARRSPPRSAREVERELASAGPGGAARRARARSSAAGVHPNDRKRIARLTELRARGIEPHASSEGLWTERAAPPDAAGRADARPRGARPPDRRPRRRDGRGRRRGGGRGPPTRAGASRTARAALGFDELLARRRRGDEGRPAPLRAPPAHLDAQDGRASSLIDRSGRDDADGRGRDRRALARIALQRPCDSRSGRRSATTTSSLEAEALPWELTAERIERICEPHFGVGSDGILLLSPARGPGVTSPSCGSSTPTAPRPSCRATAPARRSSTCAPPGWTDARHVHDRDRGRRGDADDHRPNAGLDGDRAGLGDLGRLSLRARGRPRQRSAPAGASGRFQHVSSATRSA